MELRRVQDLDLQGKRVFLRLDLNVPIKDQKITDDTRITAALPTIRYILERTNRLVICSHLGRPDGDRDPAFSLEPIGARLAELLGREVLFVDDYVDAPLEPVLDQLEKDQLVLLENLRFWPGETKNDYTFSSKLIRGFDFYVNDAFGTMHRAHASTVGAAEQIKPECRAAGFLVQAEVDAFRKVLEHPKAPFTAIMGGAKVSDKIGVMLNLINKCNHILVGGAMAYTFLKYRGVTVGKSKVEGDKLALVEAIYRNAEARRVEIVLPVDHVAATDFREDATPRIIATEALPNDVMGLDIGPQTIKKFSDIIKHSQTAFWNGPMGVFEWPGFARGTMAVAAAMAECTGTTVIGGGDSVAAVNLAGTAAAMTHISTGGGASLELLEGKVLPGMKVLLK